MRRTKKVSEILFKFFNLNLALLRVLLSDLFRNPKRISWWISRTLRAHNYSVEKIIQDAQRDPGDLSFLAGYRRSDLTKLKQRASQLHQLIPDEIKNSYSFLIPVYKPDPGFFRTTLESVLDQTSSSFEVQIGFDGPQPENVLHVIEGLRKTHPNGHRLFVHQFQHGGISTTTNRLAQLAQNRILILMDHDDWIRCDLTYRYDLTYNLMKTPQNTVLFCYEYKFAEWDHMHRQAFYVKDHQPSFPYLFCNTICHCLALPKELWNSVEGLRSECDGAQDYDLCLRLDAHGAKFECVPVELYGWRMHLNSTSFSASTKTYAHEAGLKALANYTKSKNLNWEICDGLSPTHYRAKPISPLPDGVHVIVLYKDLKEVTLKCFEHLQKQTYKKIHLTFVSNNSIDISIQEALERNGVEVLVINEAFNFSRLNNLAAKESVFAHKFESTLILNNDVYLDEDAIEEMQRWVLQPHVGCVGARLTYEDGTLQHGGISLIDNEPRLVGWIHDEIGFKDEELSFPKLIHTAHSVTGACLMIRTSLFHEIGGFDEINYPVSFSDTDLCRQIRNRNYYCLYTPFAKGVHLESKSRGFTLIEDFEASKWLHRNTDKRNLKHEKLIGQEFLDVPLV